MPRSPTLPGKTLEEGSAGPCQSEKELSILAIFEGSASRATLEWSFLPTARVFVPLSPLPKLK
jgi:hypothetical protein